MSVEYGKPLPRTAVDIVLVSDAMSLFTWKCVFSFADRIHNRSYVDSSAPPFILAVARQRGNRPPSSRARSNVKCEFSRDVLRDVPKTLRGQTILPFCACICTLHVRPLVHDLLRLHCSLAPSRGRENLRACGRIRRTPRGNSAYDPQTITKVRERSSCSTGPRGMLSGDLGMLSGK